MTAAQVADLLAPTRRVARRVAAYGHGVLKPVEDLETVPVMPEPVTRWRTTCLGPYTLGERCLHRVAARRLPMAEACEGCTRLLMDAVTGELPDLQWHSSWWRQAGVEHAGGAL